MKITTAEFYACQTLLKVKTERAQYSSILPMRHCMLYLIGCLTILSDSGTFFPLKCTSKCYALFLSIAAGSQLWKWTAFSPQGGASEGPDGWSALTSGKDDGSFPHCSLTLFQS